MEFKGTKGKRRYSNEYECITTSRIGIVEGSKTICHIKQNPSFDFSGNEAKANALLISKAPQMLEMLKDAAQNLRNGNTSNAKLEMAEKIEQLIKEATELKTE